MCIAALDCPTIRACATTLLPALHRRQRHFRAYSNVHSRAVLANPSGSSCQNVQGPNTTHRCRHSTHDRELDASSLQSTIVDTLTYSFTHTHNNGNTQSPHTEYRRAHTCNSSPVTGSIPYLQLCRRNTRVTARCGMKHFLYKDTENTPNGQVGAPLRA